jgi:hypothetical protein
MSQVAMAEPMIPPPMIAMSAMPGFPFSCLPLEGGQSLPTGCSSCLTYKALSITVLIAGPGQVLILGQVSESL